VSDSQQPPPMLDAANQIDLVCDEFETAWAKGESPRIEDYIDRCDAALKDQMVSELLLLDCELRRTSGQEITRKEYEDRFPEFSKLIGGLPFDTITVNGSDGGSAADLSKVSAGSTIAHFELLEEIGLGASGMVWRARDARLDRIVAVKFPRQERLTDTERQRFLREGRAAAKLRHPNIVTLFDVGEDQGRAFIVSELVEGDNLRRWLDERQPSTRNAAELVAQLAEALHHAHEQGVIHRDLKPANVLIDGEGQPHITDFGLAKMTADTAMTLEGHILGTPAYMSPEQARGDVGKVDRRTDVYGLGAVLYEMLSGEPPFTGDVSSIVHQVIHVEPRTLRKLVPAVPRDLETICLRAMDKEPSRRYPSAQEMAVDLRRYLRGEPILARRANIVAKSWRWLRRRPMVAAVMLLTAVLIVAGFVIAALREKNYQLQGYRPVAIYTSPPGARVAFVPIDKRTGEPDTDPSAIIRPRGVTPLTVSLRPGDYCVEAAIFLGDETNTFAEARRKVFPRGVVTDAQKRARSRRRENDDTQKISIDISRTEEVIAEMVAVPIPQRFRNESPLCPEVLYVDRMETKRPEILPNNNNQLTKDASERDSMGISFDAAVVALERQGKRMPSAAEYEAIVEWAQKQGKDEAVNAPNLRLEDLFDNHPEWTTTKYHFTGNANASDFQTLENMLLLEGCNKGAVLPGLLRMADGNLIAPPDTRSKLIGFRGVRSGLPRLVLP
jgi:eukaryotic-like serine/threonine-protein kinase